MHGIKSGSEIIQNGLTLAGPDIQPSMLFVECLKRAIESLGKRMRIGKQGSIDYITRGNQFTATLINILLLPNRPVYRFVRRRGGGSRRYIDHM